MRRALWTTCALAALLPLAGCDTTTSPQPAPPTTTTAHVTPPVATRSVAPEEPDEPEEEPEEIPGVEVHPTTAPDDTTSPPP